MKEKYTIAVAGTGYVGLSLAVLLAQKHSVTAVDILPEKVEKLNRRESPIQDEYIEKYLEEFSGVARYMKLIVESAKSSGYVKTLWGRIRYICELASSNYNLRQFGERAAMNTPIQGSAADIIKFAMNSVSKRLKEEKLETKLIMQVHDELILDAKIDELEKVEAILIDCMENAFKLRVPLVVNIAKGKNWAEAK